MRFHEHLAAFQKSKEFPAIHDDLFEFIHEHSQACPLTFCDLGCCHGLLGERLLKHGWSGFGIEGNVQFLRDALNAGVTLFITKLQISRWNLGLVGESLRSFRGGEGTSVLICRRILPELFGHDPVDGRVFARMLAASGIQEIFIQGRAATANPSNPLDSVEKEVELFTDLYTVVRMDKQCAYLRRSL